MPLTSAVWPPFLGPHTADGIQVFCPQDEDPWDGQACVLECSQAHGFLNTPGREQTICEMDGSWSWDWGVCNGGFDLCVADVFFFVFLKIRPSSAHPITGCVCLV